MPRRSVDGTHHQLRGAGRGRAAAAHPLHRPADHACYAFQLPAYIEHFRCVSVDLPGSGESSKPVGPYSTESHADQLAAFLEAIEVEPGARCRRLARRRRSACTWRHGTPAGVRSLSLHSSWATHGSLSEAGAAGELDDSGTRGGNRGGRRRDPGNLPVVLHARDVRRPPGVRRGPRGFRARAPGAAAGGIPRPVPGGHRLTTPPMCSATSSPPMLITFGGRDLCTSTLFAPALTEGNRRRHPPGGLRSPVPRRAPYEDPETFNAASLKFLLRQPALH